MQLFVYLIIFASALFVYFDVRKFRVAGVETWHPIFWALLVLVFWLFAFPVYLILRFVKFQPQLNNGAEM